MALTGRKLSELLKLIRDASTTLAVTVMGYRITPEHLQRLVADGWISVEDAANIKTALPEHKKIGGKSKGEKKPVEASVSDEFADDDEPIRIEEVKEPPKEEPIQTEPVPPDPIQDNLIIGTAFELGRLKALNPDDIDEMGFEEFKEKVVTQSPPLTPAQQHAKEHAQTRAGEFCVALGNKYSGEIISEKIIHDEEVAQKFKEAIETETAQAIEDHESVNKLTTNLRQATEDWSRDWQRIAATEMQLAYEAGFVESTKETHGKGAMMAKIPEQNACKSCRDLYLENGRPKIKPLSWWEANGESNFGRKKADWKAVTGAMHPWCRCTMVRVPAMFHFDKEWNMVPDGMELKKGLSKPPPGFTPAPHSHHGGFRKRIGAMYEYWYPEHVDGFDREVDSGLSEQQERKEHHESVAKLYGEYDIGNGKYAFIFPDPSHAGKVRISEFDSRGFYTHHTYDTLDKLKSELAGDYTQFEPSPGVLDKLAQQNEWHEGTASTMIIQNMNTLSSIANAKDKPYSWVIDVNNDINKHWETTGAIETSEWLMGVWPSIRNGTYEPEPSGDSKELKKSNSPLHGRLQFLGMNISIENRRGSIRRWYDPFEKRHGQTKMKYPYGYIRLTEGTDGEHIDCYVGPNENAPFVFVVHQRKAPDYKEHDEDKVMLGFDSRIEAKEAYLSHHDNPQSLGSMTAISAKKFSDNVLNHRYRDGKKLSKSDISIEHGAHGLTHTNKRPVGTGGYAVGSLDVLRQILEGRKKVADPHFVRDVQKDSQSKESKARRKQTIDYAQRTMEAIQALLDGLIYVPRLDDGQQRKPPKAEFSNTSTARYNVDQKIKSYIEDRKNVPLWTGKR